MMEKFSELDLAEIRAEARDLYRELGFLGTLSILHQMVVGMKILIEVIKEEKLNEESEKI